RFIRRHPVAFSLAGVLAASICCIAAVATYYAFHLGQAQSQSALQAVKAKQGRDIAVEALESIVFDAYDQLNRSDFDPDEIQIELLQSAAASLERIEISDGAPDTLHSRIESHTRIARAMWRIDLLKEAFRQSQTAFRLLKQYPQSQHATGEFRLLRLQALLTMLDVQYELGDQPGFIANLESAKSVLAAIVADRQMGPTVHALAAELHLSDANARTDQGLDASEQLAAALASHRELGGVTALDYGDALRRLELTRQLAQQELMKSSSTAEEQFDRLASMCNALIDTDTEFGFLPASAFLEYRLIAQSGLIAAERKTNPPGDAERRFEIGWSILQDFMQYDADIVDPQSAWQFVQLALAEKSVSRIRWTRLAVEIADWEAAAYGSLDRQIHWRRALLPLLEQEGLDGERDEIADQLDKLNAEMEPQN
ncbi:MAG: hypothetical protein AAGG44_15995, partial [Planctomycetota bacterium]